MTAASEHSPSTGLTGGWRATLSETCRTFERGILGALAMTVFLLVWEGFGQGWWADLLQPMLGDAANGLRVRPIFLASPSAIAEMAFQLYFVTGEMWPHLGLSAFEFFAGFLIAASIGIPFGLIAGRYRLLSDAVEPLLTALNATPQVALLPLVVLWMGTGVPARIFIVALLMIVPILINAHAAVRTIDPKWFRLARSFSASESRLFRTIIFPAAVPFLLAGTRLAIGRGMIGIVVGEIYGSSVGVGVMINQAGATFQTTRVFVGILTIVVAGLLLSEVVRRIERRVEIWRPSASAQS